jgi:hypothetical protein
MTLRSCLRQSLDNLEVVDQLLKSSYMDNLQLTAHSSCAIVLLLFGLSEKVFCNLYFLFDPIVTSRSSSWVLVHDLMLIF